MIDDSKKLKRGLGDISPLFQSGVWRESFQDNPVNSLCEKSFSDSQCVAPVRESTGKFQCGQDALALHRALRLRTPHLEICVLSAISPTTPGDSLFLNTFLASQMLLLRKPCSVLTLFEESSPPGVSLGNRDVPENKVAETEKLRHPSLSGENFLKVCEGDSRGPNQALLEDQGLTFFINFEAMDSPLLHRAITMIDKMVFFLRPNLEGVTETYRLIKWCHSFNRSLEYFLLFEQHVGREREGAIFEHFSALTTKHLGFPLMWLGSLNLADAGRNWQADLAVHHLCFSSVHPVIAPEKFALANFVLAQSHPSNWVPS